MAGVDDFVVVYMRHELCTPINAILGYSQLLLEEEDASWLGAAERGRLERVVESGRQLLHIVSEVLDPAEQTPANVADYAVRLKDAMRLPLASIQGYVEVLLEGCGQASIGNDLRRIQDASTRLADLVDTVERACTIGTGVGLDEPLLASAQACWAPGAPSADTDQTASGGAILVIDDEEANHALVARRLTRQGHSVFTAETGEAGLAIAAREPIDVILLDVLMPGISGYEVLERLKAHATLREIPVLMTTAIDGSASVTRCITLGADDYLTKPYDTVVLDARVRSCLAKKRARDFELSYLRGVATVTAAAIAVEEGRFEPGSLDEIASRSDALGNLARLFKRMAIEVAARQRRLEDQVQRLTIAIDERKKIAQVDEITESDYFRDLKARARHFAVRRAARHGAGDSD
jgi:DNA-binding response OmpR family regulator